MGCLVGGVPRRGARGSGAAWCVWLPSGEGGLLGAGVLLCRGLTHRQSFFVFCVRCAVAGAGLCAGLGAGLWAGWGGGLGPGVGGAAPGLKRSLTFQRAASPPSRPGRGSRLRPTAPRPAAGSMAFFGWVACPLAFVLVIFASCVSRSQRTACRFGFLLFVCLSLCLASGLAGGLAGIALPSMGGAYLNNV